MGRNPIISRRSAAETALRLIDEDGLDNLNLERIAKALGVRAPSLYHHFRDKAELLGEVARLVFSEVEIDHDIDDWKEFTIHFGLSVYRAVLRHPNAAALLIEAQPDRVARPGFEFTAVRLEAAGVEPALRRLIMEGTEKLTWGWTVHQAMRIQHGARRDTAASLAPKFPALARAYEANPWLEEEEMLEASLRAFIDGALALEQPAAIVNDSKRPRRRRAPAKKVPATEPVGAKRRR